MADALPPETAKVQIETLKAFTADLELSVLTVGKGYGTRPVEIAALRQWLSDALASNTDAAKRPIEGDGDAPYLDSADNREALKKVLAKVKTRVAELESAKVQPREPVKEWLTTQLAEAAGAKVLVPGLKGGETRPAKISEVKEWLHGGKWEGDFPL